MIANRYEILRTLGSGAGGTTYLVQDHETGDTLLALKTLLRDEAPEAIEKAFHQECSILAKLSHPNLARLLDFGEDKKHLYYASEFVEGENFATACRARDWNAVFSLIVQGSWGLDYLHSQKVLHRDIKPDNILVGKVHVPGAQDRQDRLVLKIIDFGLSIHQESRQVAAKEAGTLAYMAPEVLGKKPYDHRADLYSWGVVLYEMAWGRLPFAKEKNFSEYLRRLHSGSIDLNPLKESGEIPAGVLQIIEKLVVRDPNARLNQAQDIIRILNEVETENFPLVPEDPANIFYLEKKPTPPPDKATKKKTKLSKEEPGDLLDHLLSLVRSGKRNEAWDWAQDYFPAIDRAEDAAIVEKFYGACAHVLIEQGNYPEAQDFLLKMKGHPKIDERSSPELAILEIQLAFRQGHLKDADRYFTKITSSLLASASLAQRTRLENYAGMVAQSLKKYLEAAAHFETAAEFAQRSGRRDHELSLLVNAGGLYQDQGQWTKAYGIGKNAEGLAREMKHTSLLAYVLNNLGNLYLFFGRLSEAESAFSESLKLAEAENLKPLVVYNLYLLTIGEEGRGNWERVQGYLDKAREYSRELGEAQPILQSCLAGGYFYLNQEDFPKCEQAILELRQQAKKTGQDSYILQANWLEAKLRIAQGEVFKSPVSDWLLEAKADAEKRNLNQNLWQILSDLGDLAKVQGNPDQARGHYSLSLKVIEKLEKDVPEAFRSSFIRDRKKEKIRRSLEALGPEKIESKITSPDPALVFESPQSKQKEKKEFNMTLGPEGYPSPPKDKKMEKTDRSISFQKWADINRRLLMQYNVDILLEEILDAAITITDAERGFIILSETQELDIRAARNMDQESLSKDEEKISLTIAGDVMKSGKSEVIFDAQQEDRFSEARSVHALSLRSVLCVPLKSGPRTVGLVYLDNRFREGVFFEEHIPQIETLADQASLALEHARLHRENREKIQELTDSKKIIEKLNARLERDLNDTAADLEAVRESMKREHEELALRYSYENIIGKSSKIKSVLKLLDRVIDSNINVYVFGESGTGKELIAQSIHYNSPRKNKPFITENCAALAENLLESELFGHVRGAFTGADRNKIGLFQMAHGGTLFLDEVGDMSLTMQAKLLRVLQEGEVRQVGGKDYRKVDVRVVSASNRDLKKMVERGEFRQDLYFRLNVLRLDLPSLRERGQDVVLLTEHFLERISEKEGKKTPKISKGTLKIFLDYAWPGNIRELQNELHRLLMMGGDPLTPDMVSPQIIEAIQKTRGVDFKGGLEALVNEVEKKAILEAMEKYRSNKVKVAQALKIGRRTLYAKLEAFEIPSDFGKNPAGSQKSA